MESEIKKLKEKKKLLESLEHEIKKIEYKINHYVWYSTLRDINKSIKISMVISRAILPYIIMISFITVLFKVTGLGLPFYKDKYIENKSYIEQADEREEIYDYENNTVLIEESNAKNIFVTLLWLLLTDSSLPIPVLYNIKTNFNVGNSIHRINSVYEKESRDDLVLRLSIKKENYKRLSTK